MGYGSPVKITEAKKGETGSRQASWKRKCQNPTYSCQGSFCSKIEAHDIINVMFLEIKYEMLQPGDRCISLGSEDIPLLTPSIVSFC
jgi:hypothetical protein